MTVSAQMPDTSTVNTTEYDWPASNAPIVWGTSVAASVKSSSIVESLYETSTES